MIKKFKPKNFKRKDRDDKDAIHIGYIADDFLKAVPKEISNVVHSSREYLGIELNIQKYQYCYIKLYWK